MIKLNMKKKLMFLVLIINLILGQIIPVKGINFVLYDKTNDLIHFSEGITIITYGIDEYDELDIQELVIDGLAINITFVGIPVWDSYYNYTCYIRWNGDDDGNYTTASWSNGNNEVKTRLQDNTGTLLVENYQEGLIDLVSKSLIIPILNASLIINVQKPEYVYVIATTYTIGSTFYYEDELIYDANKRLTGLIISVSVASLFLIVISSYILIRRKIIKK